MTNCLFDCSVSITYAVPEVELVSDEEPRRFGSGGANSALDRSGASTLAGNFDNHTSLGEVLDTLARIASSHAVHEEEGA